MWNWILSAVGRICIVKIVLLAWLMLSWVAQLISWLVHVAGKENLFLYTSVLNEDWDVLYVTPSCVLPQLLGLARSLPPIQCDMKLKSILYDISEKWESRYIMIFCDILRYIMIYCNIQLFLIYWLFWYHDKNRDIRKNRGIGNIASSVTNWVLEK